MVSTQPETAMKQVVPYQELDLSKKEQVALMFNHIASRYDLMNTLLSFGIYNNWKKKLVKQLVAVTPQFILDVATGTADIAIALSSLHPEKIVGVDISEEMLLFGKKKIKDKNLTSLITLQKGDSENLQFADNNFNAVTVAYGVRNFENLDKGLSEMYRVLKPNGKVVILEFSQPKNVFFRKIFHFYFHKICPLVGKWVTGDKSAYSYLPQSVKAFPEGEKFITLLNQIGFKQTQCQPLTFGIASLYTGIK